MKNDSYFNILLRIAPDSTARETIPASLALQGFEGFLEEDNEIHCYISGNRWNDTVQLELKKLIIMYPRAEVRLLSITEIINRNWNEEWEQSIQPLWITEKICITPSWHTVPARDGSIILTIDPKMSFGTGYHESTRLMLRLMEKYFRTGWTILDVGTGTGILAIAAVKLGAQSALGIDIDEWSAENGVENVQLNSLTSRVDIRLGSIESVTGSLFDCVLANIQRTTILDILPEIAARMSKGGLLFLSGLLGSERTIIEDALRRYSFVTLDAMQENEWIALISAYSPG
jgi:ribosomal protein L11 methyltransferase